MALALELQYHAKMVRHPRRSIQIFFCHARPVKMLIELRWRSTLIVPVISSTKIPFYSLFARLKVWRLSLYWIAHRPWQVNATASFQLPDREELAEGPIVPDAGDSEAALIGADGSYQHGTLFWDRYGRYQTKNQRIEQRHAAIDLLGKWKRSNLTLYNAETFSS